MQFNWTNPYPTVRSPVMARNVVSTSQPLAAQAGLRILQKSGNAVDAALVEDLTGHTVLITGCGPTGLFAAAVARTAGAATIIATDVSDYRLSLAKQVGVDHVFNAKTDGPEAIDRDRAKRTRRLSSRPRRPSAARRPRARTATRRRTPNTRRPRSSRRRRLSRGRRGPGRRPRPRAEAVAPKPGAH